MDNGLLGGLAQGLQSGLLAYNSERDRTLKVKQYQDGLDAKKRAEEERLMTGGLIRTPDANNPSGPGQLSFTPEMQHKRSLETQELEGKAGAYSATSPEATSIQKYMSSIGEPAPENMSPATFKTIEPVITGRQKEKIQTKAAATKADKDQRDYAFKVGQQLSSMRGDRAVQQAEGDLYAAKKADSLFSKYPDPNKMNNTEVQLYAMDVAKIAQGGVPTQHELEGLLPTNIPQKLAKAAEIFNNEPTPANAGAFMQNLKDYSERIKKDAKDVIKDRAGRILEPAEPYLNPRDYSNFQNKYINRFEQQEKKGLVHDTDPQGPPPGVHTQQEINDAKDWLKKNPNHPDAPAVRARLGL